MNYSILSSFGIGLLHVLEPCEDKAITSLYLAWAGKNLKRSLILILAYGGGMILINTLLGLLASFLGLHYLGAIQPFLKKMAALFTFIFGILIILHTYFWKLPCHLKIVRKVNPKKTSSPLFLGLLRGLPLCPIEWGIMFWAASERNLIKGTLLVLSFSLGTALSLIPFGIGAKGILTLLERKLGKRFKKILSLFVGFIITLIGILLFWEKV